MACAKTRAASAKLSSSGSRSSDVRTVAGPPRSFGPARTAGKGRADVTCTRCACIDQGEPAPAIGEGDADGRSCVARIDPAAIRDKAVPLTPGIFPAPGLRGGLYDGTAQRETRQEHDKSPD
jgi:hypothetical protein